MTRNGTNRSGRPSLGRQLAALGERVDTLAARLDQLQPAAGDGEAAKANQRYFSSLDDFVNLWLLPTFRRPVAALGMGTWHWCPRWWAHPEARMVFGALWDSFETNRTEPLGMVELTRDLLGFLPQVCGAHGPFARCRSDTDQAGHAVRHQQVSVVATEPAPAGWWEGWWGEEDHGEDLNRPQLIFRGVEEFAVGLLLPTFRRDPNAVGMQRWNWCDQWWRHDEVVHHFLDLWYLFEARAPHKRLVEFVREVYFLLPHIHCDAGPMRECVPSGKPGGPRHADLAIAAVESRPSAIRAGTTTADWLGDHIPTVQHSQQPAAPGFGMPEPVAGGDTGSRTHYRKGREVP